MTPSNCNSTTLVQGIGYPLIRLHAHGIEEHIILGPQHRFLQLSEERLEPYASTGVHVHRDVVVMPVLVIQLQIESNQSR